MSEKASNPINLNRIKAYRYGFMVRPAGIEPATLGFGGQYSIHWATGASSKNNHLAIVSAYNASSRYNHGKVTL